MGTMNFLFALTSILFSSEAFSREQTLELIRQPRTMAMGGVGVGLADDEYALFNNVAGLAGNEKRSFRVLDVLGETSWDAVLNQSAYSAITQGASINTLNSIMGVSIPGRVDMLTLVQLPHFEIAYLMDGQLVINQYNPVNPTFDLSAMLTHGLQFGGAWSFKNGRRSPNEFRWGLSGKMLFRRGGAYDLAIDEMLKIGSDPEYAASIIGTTQTGFGFDTGFQFLRKVSPDTTFSVGSSLTDIGSTKFSDSRTLSIPMAVNLGVGVKTKLESATFSLGMDFKNLFLSTALSNKFHVGAEADLGFISLQAGLNQLNATYGAGFNFWLVRISALSFAEELDAGRGISTARRIVGEFNLNLPI